MSGWGGEDGDCGDVDVELVSIWSLFYGRTSWYCPACCIMGFAVSHLGSLATPHSLANQHT